MRTSTYYSLYCNLWVEDQHPECLIRSFLFRLVLFYLFWGIFSEIWKHNLRSSYKHIIKTKMSLKTKTLVLYM